MKLRQWGQRFDVFVFFLTLQLLLSLRKDKRINTSKKKQQRDFQ
jgi:hypothetical protein